MSDNETPVVDDVEAKETLSEDNESKNDAESKVENEDEEKESSETNEDKEDKEDKEDNEDNEDNDENSGEEKPKKKKKEDGSEEENGEEKSGEEGDNSEEDGEDGVPKKKKKKKKDSPPPRRKAPAKAPPPPPPKVYDVPKDTWSSGPVSNRVWEVDEEEEFVDQGEPDFDFSDTGLLNDYEPGKELGRGFFATAKLIKDKKTNENAVVKIIEKSMAPQFTSDGLKSELDTLSKLNHENVIKGKKLYETDSHLLVVLEFAAGGEFSSVLGKNASGSYSEKDAQNIAKQIVDAVAHVHKNNIIHGDIAPENIFFSSEDEKSGVVKLGGFSGAIQSSGEVNQQMIGNSEFQAPELLMNQDFSSKADIWSLGCMLYYLIEGNSPFADSNTMRMNMKIRQGKIEFGDNWNNVSSSLKNLISSLIKVNPSARLSIEEIQKNEWFSSNVNASLPNTRKAMLSC